MYHTYYLNKPHIWVSLFTVMLVMLDKCQTKSFLDPYLLFKALTASTWASSRE